MKTKEIRALLINKKNKIKDTNILCIGDMILDHNINGRVDRVSPEAPVPIVLIDSQNYQLGGVGNVAMNISSLGGNSSILYLSNDIFPSNIIRNLIKKEKRIRSFEIKIDDFKIPIKSRYKNNFKQIIRIDNEIERYKLKSKYKDIILNKLKHEIKKYDLLVLSDYNKGLLDKDLIKKITRLAKNNNIKVIVDPKKNDFSSYANTDLITPNEKEIRDAAKKKILSQNQIVNFSKKTISENNIQNILITRSEKGMLLVSKYYSKKYLANAKKITDVTGAGDTVIAIIALMLSIGLNLEESIIISNYAAGLVIGKHGTENISFNELTK